jgi:hypothetical protein
MKRCHRCKQPVQRFRQVVIPGGLRVILCLTHAARYDR